MRTLSLFAVSVGAALVCAAVPASINWSPASETLLSMDTAQARVGRPLTPGSVAGVNRRVERRAYRRGAVGAGVVAAGAVATGAYLGGPASASYYDSGPAGGGAPASYGGYGGPGYGPGGGQSAVVVNPATGRWCSLDPSGWRWCWTP
jgi:hypothetical protein